MPDPNRDRRRCGLSAPAAWALLTVLMAWAGSAAGFDPGRAGFEVRFKGLDLPYRVMALFVAPGEVLELEVIDPLPGENYTLTAVDGTVTPLGKGKWSLSLPRRPGCRPATIVAEPADAVMTLNIFVLTPREQVRDGVLNGFHIGEYPSVPLKGLEIYRPPAGFVELGAETADLAVSPHFRLGQFDCKQEGGYPRYLAVRTRLLLKLELVLEEVNRQGIPCETLAVLSGYRTPYYNKAIGNVKYSRHVWGGAADIFVDADPQDGMMDDLNGDGSLTIEDAAVLYKIVDDLYGEPEFAPFIGGLGRYRRTAAHGPFVHVDVRGFRARWGD